MSKEKAINILETAVALQYSHLSEEEFNKRFEINSLEDAIEIITEVKCDEDIEMYCKTCCKMLPKEAKHIVDSFGLNPINLFDFEVFTGFNTKQLWILANIKPLGEPVLIDPPISALDKCYKGNPDWENREYAMMELLSDLPSWLWDENYWYDAADTEV